MGGKASQERRLKKRKAERVLKPVIEDTSLRKDDILRKRREEYWNRALGYTPKEQEND